MEYHVHFRVQDIEARTCESVGVSTTVGLNYSWMCTNLGVLLAMSAWICARVGWQKSISKHKEGPSQFRRLSYSPSLPALWSDHRTTLHVSKPTHLSVCSLHGAVVHTHSPVSHRLTFFSCGFLHFTFADYRQRPSGRRCLYKPRDLLCHRSGLIPPD